jgi:hypothetical protein
MGKGRGNPNPNRSGLKNFQPQGDYALGRSINTRYPLDVEAALDAMPDKQAFIRAAVAEKLLREGLLTSTEKP